MNNPQTQIPLYYWNDVPNFGDQLSAPIVSWILGKPIKQVNRKAKKKLLAVGSILQFAKEGDYLWGTGIHPNFYHTYLQAVRRSWWISKKLTPLPKINVLAVRGPITRDVLMKHDIACPNIFGDPALLLPQLYSPPQPRIKRKVLLFPHFSDYDRYKGSTYDVVDARSPWQSIVDEIRASEKVISTSLHGLIVAEAYGVPAFWLRETFSEGYIKFADYYLGTQRDVRAYYSIEEADSAKAYNVPQIDLSQLMHAIQSKIDKLSDELCTIENSN